jgi:hypothetical protein
MTSILSLIDLENELLATDIVAKEAEIKQIIEVSLVWVLIVYGCQMKMSRK